jgi:hypothetical protein
MNKTLCALIPAIVVVLVGCGKSETYQSPDGTMNVEQEGDTATYEVVTKDGKATLTASDTEVAIPDTFPKDVPLLKGAVAKMSMTQGKSEVLHLCVPGSIADVAKEYQDKLKAEGWEIESTVNMGDAAMLQARKGTRQCAAMVMKDDEGGSLVQLTVTQE